MHQPRSPFFTHFGRAESFLNRSSQPHFDSSARIAAVVRTANSRARVECSRPLHVVKDSSRRRVVYLHSPLIPQQLRVRCADENGVGPRDSIMKTFFFHSQLEHPRKGGNEFASIRWLNFAARCLQSLRTRICRNPREVNRVTATGILSLHGLSSSAKFA